jgi:hypothetical protein
MGGEAFLTLTQLSDPDRHDEYNAWHQLDHLPENLVQPGVEWGNRWVRTPECAASSSSQGPDSADAQYLVMYQFRPPLDVSIAEWTELNQRAQWWGRRPELLWTIRMPLGFFSPVAGYASPRVLVSADAVPHRPHLGIHLTVPRYEGELSAAAMSCMADYDRRVIPAVLNLPGVAGVLTYRMARPAAGFGFSEALPQTAFVRLVFADADPVRVGEVLLEDRHGWLAGEKRGERLHFMAPFRTITPWDWSWFSRPSGGEAG